MTTTLSATPPAPEAIDVDDQPTEQCCSNCAIPIAPDDVQQFGPDRYCPDCVSECDHCHVLVPDSVLDDDLCPPCRMNYRACYCCGDRTHVDDLTHTSQDESVCDRCLREYYTYCDSCDEYEPDDDRCNYRSDLVEDYSYKPYPEFHHAAGEVFESARPYFGVELETEAMGGDLSEGADLVSSALGELVYLKTDGSLNYGFEIVTHPMSLAFAQGRDWSVLRSLAQLGFRSWQTGTCGTHVHVSRAGFKGRAHVWRFAHLIYRNATDCERLAGRSSSSWASFHGQRSEVAKVLKHETSPERYVAVNLCNTDTVEVRMFRASLNPTRLLADIECVAAALEHTRHLTVPDVKAGALDWWAFRAFLADHETTYPNLTAILAKGGN